MSRDGGGDGVGTYTGSIPVCVKGTIKSSQYVTVSVNTPTLTCEDGTTAAVSLSQPKDTWTCDEVSGDGTTANFAVSTELAQPGDWSGTATFGCELGASVPLITFKLFRTYQAEEGMTWEEFCESSYCPSNPNGVKYVATKSSTDYVYELVGTAGEKVCLNGVYVSKTDVIIDGATYGT